VQEAGCLRFDVLQDSDDPSTICLYEVFRTEEDLAIHRAQAYYKRWMEISREWRDPSGGSRRVLRNIHPADREWTAATEIRS
jgi:(4S)-4-hydroxy-5-phosphonooxypentane-2,3-dione isomerase